MSVAAGLCSELLRTDVRLGCCFQVANGTFLGIPRDATVAAALDERTNETVSGLCPFRVGRAPLLTCSAFQVGITVKEAQDTATTLTVAVG